MKAKKYLEQRFYIKAKIKANKDELERLRELAESMPSSDWSREGGNITGFAADRIGNAVAKIVDLESAINDEIAGFVDLEHDIRKRITALNDDPLRLVLQKRYINFQTWEQIAEDLNFSFQWIHILHKRALNEVERTL